VWEGESGRQRGEVDIECVKMWEGGRGRQRMGAIKVCVRECGME
jgi:hypothetical protein